MKPLKFRIWIPEAKMGYSETGMYYQNTQYLSSFLRRIYNQFSASHPAHMPFQLEDRMMQFTGLLDKNGKEIYEGDIVKLDQWKPSRYEVVFDRGGFCLKFGEEGAYYPDIKYAEDSVVIGNVHENPELLK